MLEAIALTATNVNPISPVSLPWIKSEDTGILSRKMSKSVEEW